MRGKKGSSPIAPILTCQYCNVEFTPKAFRLATVAKVRYCSQVCACRARNTSSEMREKVRLSRTGCKISEETKAKWTISRTGKHPTDISKMKSSQSHRKLLENPDVRARLLLTNKGTRFTGELKGIKHPRWIQDRSLVLLRRRLSQLTYNLVKRILKPRKMKKKNHSEVILGYTRDDLRRHIESQFQIGMSWENYCHKTWHIDHIRPISSFSADALPSEISALSNLQPLWAKDNQRKWAKV
jgi:hypothetical protein